MTWIFKNSYQKGILVTVSVLSLLQLLTSCMSITNTLKEDKNNECHQVTPCQKPYTDLCVGMLLKSQEKMIDTCDALLAGK